MSSSDVYTVKTNKNKLNEYIKKANNNDMGAIKTLGVYYYNIKDYINVIYYLNKIVFIEINFLRKNGNVDLIYIYYLGKSYYIIEDYKNAIYYLNITAEYNFSDSIKQLIKYYTKKEPNQKLRKYWLKKDIKYNNCINHKYVLAKIYYEEKKYIKALDLFKFILSRHLVRMDIRNKCNEYIAKILLYLYLMKPARLL